MDKDIIKVANSLRKFLSKSIPENTIKYDIRKAVRLFNINVRDNDKLNYKSHTIVEDKRYTIELKSSLSENDKRFYIAKELGHILLHIPEGFNGIFKKAEEMTSFTTTREAYNFAAALLLPKEILQDEIKRVEERVGLNKDIIEFYLKRL